jgi:hypothetical protein
MTAVLSGSQEFTLLGQNLDASGNVLCSELGCKEDYVGQIRHIAHNYVCNIGRRNFRLRSDRTALGFIHLI